MVKAKVLVVEDEAIVAEDLRNILEGQGHVVLACVSSGEEAVQKTADTRPDLVLMDIVLKGAMDGVKAADRIRSRWNIPVVYLTAHSDDTTFESAKRTEPFGYLVKPFTAREIHTTIQLALYNHKKRKRRESQAGFAAKRKKIGDTAILAQETAPREGVVTGSMARRHQKKGRLRQLVRCHQILERLASQRVDYDANILAEELGFTRKTIYRDLRALKEAGIFIEYDRPRKRYRIGKHRLVRAYLSERSE